MNKFTPRKWAARRKMGKRPERVMRRDQAQVKQFTPTTAPTAPTSTAIIAG